MRRRKLRIIRLATIALLAGAATAPTAMAGDVSGDELPTDCAAWARSMSLQLAYAGIFGDQADAYIAQRQDNPCHRPITARSLFHAGDPA